MGLDKAAKFRLENNLEINDIVLVLLEQACYFDLWDGSREVYLMDKKEMERKLSITKNLSNEKKREIYKKSGYMMIQKFGGYYVGHRQDLIKITPFYGLQGEYSEYFIIPVDSIKDIIRVSHFREIDKNREIFKRMEEALDGK